MAAIGKPAKQNILILLEKQIPIIGFGVISLNSEFEHCSSEFTFQFKVWPPERQWHHLQKILSCQRDQYGRLDTLNIKIRLQTAEIIFQFNLLFQNRTLALLANNPIMQKRLIWSFRNLKYQNMSIILDSISRARMMQQFRIRGGKVRRLEEYICLQECDNSVKQRV